MILKIKHWWWKRKQLNDFEKAACESEFKALSPALKAKNLRGLVSLHKKDIDLHKAELADLEKEREARKKYTDTELVKIYQEGIAESMAEYEELKKAAIKKGEEPPKPLAEYTEQGPALAARLRKENNEDIVKIEHEIKVHKEQLADFEKDLGGEITLTIQVKEKGQDDKEIVIYNQAMPEDKMEMDEVHAIIHKALTKKGLVTLRSELAKQVNIQDRYRTQARWSREQAKLLKNPKIN